MLKKNHLIISETATLAALSIANLVAPLPPEMLGAALLGGSVGAVAPDYDLKIPQPVSDILFKILFAPVPSLRKRKIQTGHRTYSHSLLFVLVLCVVNLVVWFFNSYAFWAVFGFNVGYIFHLIADMTTYSGIPLLWPYSNQKFYVLPKLLRFSTGKSFLETIYTVLLSAFFCFIFVTLFLMPWLG